MMIKYSTFFFLLLSVYACNIGTVTPTDQDFGKNYYPLKVGKFVIYDVKKIKYNELTSNDTSIYQLKEVVADTFRNTASELVYRLERFRRAAIIAPWQLDSVWTSRLDNNSRYVRIENNVSFIRLVLPTDDGLVWNGNALNVLKEDFYILENVKQAFQTKKGLFSNTISVLQNNDVSLVDKDVRLEIYADTIGLIYKKSETYQYIADANNSNFGKDVIVTGDFLEQSYFQHGKEK